MSPNSRYSLFESLVPLPVNNDISTRDLTDAEQRLTRWMLEHGESEAQQLLPQLDHARATLWRCPCGCASINFSIEGQSPPASGMHIVADFVFGDEADMSGIFVFEKGGILSGLEVYGLAGGAPQTLPTSNSLRSLPVNLSHA